jgi:hypothetical protein
LSSVSTKAEAVTDSLWVTVVTDNRV